MLFSGMLTVFGVADAGADVATWEGSAVAVAKVRRTIVRRRGAVERARRRAANCMVVREKSEPKGNRSSEPTGNCLARPGWPCFNLYYNIANIATGNLFYGISP